MPNSSACVPNFADGIAVSYVIKRLYYLCLSALLTQVNVSSLNSIMLQVEHTIRGEFTLQYNIFRSQVDIIDSRFMSSGSISKCNIVDNAYNSSIRNSNGVDVFSVLDMVTASHCDGGDVSPGVDVLSPSVISGNT